LLLDNNPRHFMVSKLYSITIKLENKK